MGSANRSALRRSGNSRDVWPWLQLLGNLGLRFPLGALLPLRTPWLASFRNLTLTALALTARSR